MDFDIPPLLALPLYPEDPVSLLPLPRPLFSSNVDFSISKVLLFLGRISSALKTVGTSVILPSRKRDLLVIPPIPVPIPNFLLPHLLFPNVVAPTEESLSTGFLSTATPASIVANFCEQRVDFKRMS
jgi:hypothetical protein